MSRRTAAAVLVAAVLASVACGETIDLRDQPETTAPGTTGAGTTPAGDAAVAPPVDGPLDELLPALLDSWRGLDQRVIDGDAAEPLERIETTWAAAEPLVRADHPTSLFGFEQAVGLARSAVERRRPADASKGYRLAIELTDEVLAR